SATIPVYFHVVTAGAEGQITDAQLAAQIDVLNRTFAGKEGGTRTGFSFTLAGVTRTDNPSWFYASSGGKEERAMKKALHAGRAHAHVGLPGGQGHVRRSGPGPDPQLHGLLLRLLLHGVHAGPDAAHARRLAAVSGLAAVLLHGVAEQARQLQRGHRRPER